MDMAVARISTEATSEVMRFAWFGICNHPCCLSSLPFLHDGKIVLYPNKPPSFGFNTMWKCQLTQQPKLQHHTLPVTRNRSLQIKCLPDLRVLVHHGTHLGVGVHHGLQHLGLGHQALHGLLHTRLLQHLQHGTHVGAPTRSAPQAP